MRQTVLMAWLIGLGATVPVGAGAATPTEVGLRHYIVVATDRSFSMNDNDEAVVDAHGRKHYLRYDAQKTFFVLLPVIASGSKHVGVVHFGGQVEYCYPPEPRGDLTAPYLVEWNDPWPSPAEIERLVPPVGTTWKIGTALEVPMTWALNRIQGARQRHGPSGQAALILLSDGDPHRAGNELLGKGPVTKAVSRLAAEGVRVYAIIINRKSYRESGGSKTLTGLDARGERLMEDIAKKTGGKVYRITASRGLEAIVHDILADLDAAPSESIPAAVPFLVSRHHRTVVLVGAPIDAVRLANGRVLSISAVTDLSTGIRVEVWPLAQWQVVVFRRPASSSRLDEVWAGEWRLAPGEEDVPSWWWIYRIPDFLLRLAPVPADPWWTYQRVAVRAELASRPEEVVEVGDRPTPPLSGTDLELALEVVPVAGGEGIRPPAGQWSADGASYTTPAFSFRAAGSYQVRCDVFGRVNGASILLGRFVRGVEVVPCGVRTRLVAEGGEAAGEVLYEMPGPGLLPPAARCRGGDQVRAEVGPVGPVDLKSVEGAVRLDGLDPAAWPLAPRAGAWVTAPIRLPQVASSRVLTGEVAAQVRDAHAEREVVLPVRLLFERTPPRVEAIPAEWRRALWAGELHEQDIHIRIGPLSAGDWRSVQGDLADKLKQARVRAVTTGTFRELKARFIGTDGPRLLEDGQRCEATYRVTVQVPLPRMERCVIDLGSIGGLAAPPLDYVIVDPVAEGLFVWNAGRDEDPQTAPGCADVLYRKEGPVRFAAAWKPSLDVAGVRFEIFGPSGETVQTVPLKVEAGMSRASAPASIDGLQPGESYMLHVCVTLRPPAGNEPARTVRLDGGQLVVDDPRLRPGVVGFPSVLDQRARTYERTELPLRAEFQGYDPTCRAHRDAVNRFRTSCRVAFITPEGEATAVPLGMWRPSYTPPAVGQSGRLRLENRAILHAHRHGWATLHMEAEVLGADGLVRPLLDSMPIHIQPPRVVLEVRDAPPENAAGRILFDSYRNASGAAPEPPEPAFIRNLWCVVRRADRDDPTGLDAWNLVVRPLHSSPSNGEATPLRPEALSLLGPGANASKLFTPTKNGVYAFELATAPGDTASPQIRLVTPPVAQIVDRSEIIEVLPPAPVLTTRTRVWPFEYRVQLPADWAPRWQEFVFEFQIPGVDETWQKGRAHCKKDEQENVWLNLTHPEVMAPLAKVRAAPAHMQLRVRQGGGEQFHAASRPQVRVVDAGLQGIQFYRSGTTAPAERLDPKVTAEVRAPVALTAALDLKRPADLNWWQWQSATVYKMRDTMCKYQTGQLSDDALRRLIGQIKAKSDAVELFPVTEDSYASGRVVIDVADPCGWWPSFGRKERYVVVAAVTYDTPCEVEQAGGGINAPKRLVEEWTDAYVLTVVVLWHVPPFWWIVAGGVAFGLLSAGVVQIVRWGVPRPETLGLRLWAPAGDAVLTPNVGNAAYAVVRETGMLEEWGVCRRQERNRLVQAIVALAYLLLASQVWHWLGVLLAALSRKALAPVAAFVVVLGRWLWSPRRRAWVEVALPDPSGELKVRPGVVCIARTRNPKTFMLWWTGHKVEEVDPQGKPLPQMNVPVRYRHQHVWTRRTVRLALEHELPRRRDAVSEPKQGNGLDNGKAEHDGDDRKTG